VKNIHHVQRHNRFNQRIGRNDNLSRHINLNQLAVVFFIWASPLI